MLGMAIESFSPTGSKCAPEEPGELVCVKPFPCMPLGFWPLPGFASEPDVKAASVRYQQAYFAEFEGVWYLCFSGSVPEQTIVDALAVGQKVDGGADERVILFIKLPEGQMLSTGFEQKIKAEIRNRRSPRHVPTRIIQVTDVPYTLNGKRVEVLVKKIINGAPLSSVNPATLSNPECLAFYAEVGTALRLEVEQK
ncbi:hypothetical protein H0H81_008659 [Sphagnurus paluster]|uniref:Acetoacetyl-CoA synthetase n=1 Tax=Sphagnurus paluster TaxID=117069 RepID=A0A9P7GIT4_9AGAR|nr:hypothetical protein H0H81_008659 [Sphagnurus paluster]